MIRLSSVIRSLAAGLAALALAACGSQGVGQRGPVVLAAASLQDALSDAADVWTAEGHARPVLSFAGTPAIARQVESGAPADLFISADEEWMERLSADGHVRAGTAAVIAENALVLVAPTDASAAVDLADPASIRTALGESRLAMADPDSVPAGRYGKAALEAIGAWKSVSGRIAAAQNVRAALALVERGAVPLGIVYATDAEAAPDVRVVASFPASSHPPIRYPAALLTASKHKDAAAFLAFLQTPAARAAFVRHGFRPPQ